MPNATKIAFIGATSMSFGLSMLRDVFSNHELRGSTLTLVGRDRQVKQGLGRGCIPPLPSQVRLQPETTGHNRAQAAEHGERPTVPAQFRQLLNLSSGRDRQIPGNRPQAKPGDHENGHRDPGNGQVKVLGA